MNKMECILWNAHNDMNLFKCIYRDPDNDKHNKKHILRCIWWNAYNVINDMLCLKCNTIYVMLIM